MKWLLQILTWWNGQTLATRFYTWRHGQKVGEDAEGNVYYQTPDGSRRWVIYNGEVEASRIAPEWHGWLHHTWQQPPTVAPLPSRPWIRPHRPNPTGSEQAYRPGGSLLAAASAPVPRDYEAWTPE